MIDLLKKANVEDTWQANVRLIGWGYVSTGEASCFQNFPSRDADLSQKTIRMLHEAIGTYRARIFETFLPMYWIELLLYLPREILRYLGLPPESLATKTLQLFYWFLGLVATVLWAFFQSRVEQIVGQWLNILMR